MQKIMPKDIIDDVCHILDEQSPLTLTGYQVLQKLPPPFRYLLLLERGRAGQTVIINSGDECGI